jgi:phage terminase large subunit GpA-like protein
MDAPAADTLATVAAGRAETVAQLRALNAVAEVARGTGVRFSHSLEAPYFEQVASERKVIRYVRGQPIRRFERISGRAAEALDYLVYAHAARAGLQVSLDAREGELATPTPPQAPTTIVQSPFVQAW